jgi:hypothetical protein
MKLAGFGLFCLLVLKPINAGECDRMNDHPEWIFCDDFESTGPMVAPGRYFEYGDNGGDCVVMDSLGLDGSRGLRVVFQKDEVGAGGMKLAFGRNPNGYMRKGIRPNDNFREIYYRQYLKMQAGWEGNPAKLSRATVFTSSSDWSQAMIAHLWSDGNYHLLLDPVRCVDDQGSVKCIGYNDFPHMSWLGNKSGVTPIFATDHSGVWYCVEMHVKLNDPGQSNGLCEFWIDGNLEARRDNLNFVGTYTGYAINAVFFENYWNSGSIKEQERYFDNIVVSTQPIGAYNSTALDNSRSGACPYITVNKPTGYYTIDGRKVPAGMIRNGIYLETRSGRKVQKKLFLR